MNKLFIVVVCATLFFAKLSAVQCFLPVPCPAFPNLDTGSNLIVVCKKGKHRKSGVYIVQENEGGSKQIEICEPRFPKGNTPVSLGKGKEPMGGFGCGKLHLYTVDFFVKRLDIAPQPLGTNFVVINGVTYYGKGMEKGEFCSVYEPLLPESDGSTACGGTAVETTKTCPEK